MGNLTNLYTKQSSFSSRMGIQHYSMTLLTNSGLSWFNLEQSSLEPVYISSDYSRLGKVICNFWSKNIWEIEGVLLTH